MKKKEFLTEAKRKAIIADKEKAILESFAKTFNKIKRVDENEINENNDNTLPLIYSALIKAVGVDKALTVLDEENKFIIKPINLIVKAVKIGLISISDIDENIVYAAIEEAEDINDNYRDSGEGIGSSDINSFVRSFLHSANKKVDFINGRLQRTDENEINEEDDVEADILDKDIVSVNSKIPPYKELGYYKIKTDVDYGISRGEKQTYWHPGDSPNIEDVQVNLEPNAIQLDDNGEEIGVIELPSSHYRAIEDRIIQDIEFGFDKHMDTTYYTEPEYDGDDY